MSVHVSTSGFERTLQSERRRVAGDAEQLYWLQVLPPRMVEVVGREDLLSAPAWRAEELADGAVLLVSYANPHVPDFETKDEIEDIVGVELRTYWT